MLTTCPTCSGYGHCFRGQLQDEGPRCWRCGGSGRVSDGVAPRPAVQDCYCSECMNQPVGCRPPRTVQPDRPVRDVVLGLLVAVLVLGFLVWGLAVIPA